jgi:cytidyltransferase-like protein
MSQVAVSGSFDDLRSRDVRFLEEASRLGEVTVILWPDEQVRLLTGKEPEFMQAEREYLLLSLRCVSRVAPAPGRIELDSLPFADDLEPDLWAVTEAVDTYEKRLYCASFGLGYRVIRSVDLLGWPEPPEVDEQSVQRDGDRPKVLVTGCFDWLHSGHVRFFEEAAQFGDLYVAIGHDANIRLLKGEGHPLFSQEERRYMVQSVKYVRKAIITSGQGWMDAAPEIERLHPDIYLVNEDGDQPEKREFCRNRGVEYIVMKRLPKPGLPRRESTTLRRG